MIVYLTSVYIYVENYNMDENYERVRIIEKLLTYKMSLENSQG